MPNLKSEGEIKKNDLLLLDYLVVQFFMLQMRIGNSNRDLF